MTFPVHNARLTKIAGQGFSEDYDQPEGSDTDKWTGDSEAYIRERVLAAVSGSSLDEVKQTWLTIPSSIPVVTGDSATYLKDGTSFTRHVRDVEDHGVIGVLRLHLWDA